MSNKKTKINRGILILLWLPLALSALPGAGTYAQQELSYDPAGRPDPFTPWVTPDGRMQILKNRAEEADQELEVQGIMYDKYGISYAIVNSEVVKIGDLAAGYQVLKIEKDKVTFIKEGQIKEVEFMKED